MDADAVKISLSNFQDEAWLFVRMNKERPADVQGGTLTELAGGLYLLEAHSNEVIINLEA